MHNKQRNNPPSVRIIGGTHRGRQLTFLPNKGLRPTPDRVRETLFNWLTSYVNNASCLDLFAGSGALALEAISRGAKNAILIDNEVKNIQQLTKIVTTWGLTEKATLLQADSISWLEQVSRKQSLKPFDIIFIDPPYSTNYLPIACKALSESGLIADGGLIYVEHPVSIALPSMPPNWQIYKNKKAGQVNFYLWKNTYK